MEARYQIVQTMIARAVIAVLTTKKFYNPAAQAAMTQARELCVRGVGQPNFLLKLQVAFARPISGH
jgi:hypothetical protein